MSIVLDCFGRPHGPIQVTVTKVESEVDSIIKLFMDRKKKVIGLDTEWSVDEDKKSHVAILQLCDEKTCLIVQLQYFDSVPKSLFNFLRMPQFAFVGIGIEENVAKLGEEYGLGCKNAVELGPHAARVHFQPRLSGCGIDEIARATVPLLYLVTPSSVLFCDWGVDCLSYEQIKYAASNVYAYHRVGYKMSIPRSVRDY